jgi:hypothetical protein
MAKGKKGARQRGEPKLIGAKEAAEICGVRQPNLRTQSGLPEPYDTCAATTLWREDEMRAYAARRYAEKAERQRLAEAA